MNYAPHEHLVRQAQNGREGIGLTILSSLLIIFGIGVTSLTLYGFVSGWMQAAGTPNAMDTLINARTPGTMLLMLFSFGLWSAILSLILRSLHNRALLPMLGQRVWPQFRAVLIAMIALNLALVLLPPWGLFADTKPGLATGTWLLLLPISLLAILIQVSAEELMFRGFLQQQLAARFKNPIVWIIVPSAIFAIAHHDPAMGSNAWLVVIWAGLFGVMMADLTARSGSLGPAIAVHFTNNVFAMLLLSPPDNLSGLALRLLTFELSNESAVRELLYVDLGLMLVSWLAARLALRR